MTKMCKISIIIMITYIVNSPIIFWCWDTKNLGYKKYNVTYIIVYCYNPSVIDMLVSTFKCVLLILLGYISLE